MPFAAVLDASVLYPLPLRDTLLRVAEIELSHAQASRPAPRTKTKLSWIEGFVNELLEPTGRARRAKAARNLSCGPDAGVNG